MNWSVDRLHVQVHPDRGSLGSAAGNAVASALREVLSAQARARIVFAAAPSQEPMLEVLREAPGIDWLRVTAFHMDEYVGIDPDARQSFGRFLEDRLFGSVRPGQVRLIRPGGEPDSECRRYAALLAEAPLDLVCLGIGENAHVAFNDPGTADFSDPYLVKAVELDEMSRRQQVNDGCFAGIEAVPRKAITLTVPALLSARRMVAVVPGSSKAAAVRATLTEPVHETRPASALRTHPDCVLYLDEESAADLR
jgi:glucosamine-6-phosphate deaminase